MKTNQGSSLLEVLVGIGLVTTTLAFTGESVLQLHRAEESVRSLVQVGSEFSLIQKIVEDQKSCEATFGQVKVNVGASALGKPQSVVVDFKLSVAIPGTVPMGESGPEVRALNVPEGRKQSLKETRLYLVSHVNGISSVFYAQLRNVFRRTGGAEKRETREPVNFLVRTDLSNRILTCGTSESILENVSGDMSNGVLIEEAKTALSEGEYKPGFSGCDHHEGWPCHKYGTHDTRVISLEHLSIFPDYIDSKGKCKNYGSSGGCGTGLKFLDHNGEPIYVPGHSDGDSLKSNLDEGIGLATSHTAAYSTGTAHGSEKMPVPKGAKYLLITSGLRSGGGEAPGGTSDSTVRFYSYKKNNINQVPLGALAATGH